MYQTEWFAFCFSYFCCQMCGHSFARRPSVSRGARCHVKEGLWFLALNGGQTVDQVCTLFANMMYSPPS